MDIAELAIALREYAETRERSHVYGFSNRVVVAAPNSIGGLATLGTVVGLAEAQGFCGTEFRTYLARMRVTLVPKEEV